MSCRGLQTVLRILGETRLDDAVQTGGVIGAIAEIGAGSVLMIAEISDAWLCPENAFLARRHLVEHHAEGEDVRPRIRFFAFQLLGSHVLEGPEDRPLLRSAVSLRDSWEQRRRHRRRARAVPSPWPVRSRGASPPTS